MKVSITWTALFAATTLAWGCSHAAPSVVPTATSAIDRARPTGASPAIYVTQQGKGAQLLTFRQSDNGDVAPQRVIDGSGAGVLTFGGLAVSLNGDLYASDLTNNAIVAYPRSASGPAPPLLTISCGGLNYPNSLVFDKIGHLYAANGGAAPFSVSVLPANASGCVNANPIIEGVRTRLYNPQGIASTRAGKLYVINNNNSITEYAAGASGDAGWTHRIHGPDTGLATSSQCGNADAIDGAGDIYAANAGGNSITVYAPNADGDAIPIRTISGSSTGLDVPRGVAVDSSGDIFVANSAGSSILVFGPGANGDVAPIRTIAGSRTRLSDFIVGIALSR